MPIKNRPRRDLPPAPGIGLGNSKGAAGTFKPADIAAIVAQVRYPSVWPPELMDSWLDNALTLYLGNFATAPDGAPSEKEEWAANLRTAVENCLEMLDPDFDPKQGGQPSVDRRAYSHLFSLFPTNFSPQQYQERLLRGLEQGRDWVSILKEDPHLAPGPALNGIAKVLASLWSFADQANKEWSSRKGKMTNKVADWRLSWVGLLGCIYALAFRRPPPRQPIEEPPPPFICFCEAVRAHALTVKRRASATDAAAFRDLEEFTAGSLVAFIRREAPAGRLGGAWAHPDQIRPSL